MTAIEEIATRFRLNGLPVVCRYDCETRNIVQTKDLTSHVCVAQPFTIELLRQKPSGNLEFRVKTERRLFLDENDRPITTWSKAQRMAMVAAGVNDDLVFEISKNFGLLRLMNTDEVRARWNDIKSKLCSTYAGLEDKISDFDWQMKEENIQSAYRGDNFYNFFFCNLFYRDFLEGEPVADNKVLSNALGRLDIPIVELKTFSEDLSSFEIRKIILAGEIDTENKHLPLQKMNIFMGGLSLEEGAEVEMDFQYNGHYDIRAATGVLEGGQLQYEIKLNDHYKKTTSIRFKHDDDER